MRRILIDYARRRLSLKRGGSLHRVELDEFVAADCDFGEELVAIDDSLQGLAQVDAQAAELVKLRVFAGCRFPKLRSCSAFRVPLPTKMEICSAWLAAHM